MRSKSNLLNKFDCSSKKQKYMLFIFLAISLLFTEFVISMSYFSIYQPKIDNYFVIGNKTTESITNILTMTDVGNIVIKGSGWYRAVIKNRNNVILYTKSGFFNKTGYATISFYVTPDKFIPDQKYIVEVECHDNPFGLFFRDGKIETTFRVSREFSRLKIGIIPDNKTPLVTVRLTDDDENTALANEKIIIKYKKFATDEKLKRVGATTTDKNGFATIPLNITRQDKIILLVAIFYGNNLYRPTVVEHVFSRDALYSDDYIDNISNNEKHKFSPYTSLSASYILISRFFSFFASIHSTFFSLLL